MKRRGFFRTGLMGIGAAAFARETWALKYYPLPSNKKWAVLYGTWCGTSRDAAVWISEGLGGIADVFDVREQPDLKPFDYLVIGGSIRGGKTSKELQDFLSGRKDILKDKIRGLFAVCGNMRNPVGPEQTAQFIDNHLAPLCGAGKVPSKVFLGRITKSLMEPQMAEQMKEMEDYDNLKREDGLAFGRAILASMK